MSFESDLSQQQIIALQIRSEMHTTANIWFWRAIKNSLIYSLFCLQSLAHISQVLYHWATHLAQDFLFLRKMLNDPVAIV
jgi:hypothetical protein